MLLFFNINLTISILYFTFTLKTKYISLMVVGKALLSFPIASSVTFPFAIDNPARLHFSSSDSKAFAQLKISVVPFSLSEIFSSLSMAGSFFTIKSQLKWCPLKEALQQAYLNRFLLVTFTSTCLFDSITLVSRNYIRCSFGTYLLMHLPIPYFSDDTRCFMRVKAMPALLTTVYIIRALGIVYC